MACDKFHHRKTRFAVTEEMIQMRDVNTCELIGEGHQVPVKQFVFCLTLPPDHYKTCTYAREHAGEGAIQENQPLNAFSPSR